MTLGARSRLQMMRSLDSCETDVSAQEAREILSKLDKGVPPPDQLIAAIQRVPNSTCQRVMMRIGEAEKDRTEPLFLIGDPGAGKSHALSVLRATALESGFAVARFELDLASRCMPNRPDLFVRRMITTLSLPDDPSAIVDPLRCVLDRWATLALAVSGDPIHDMRYLGGVCEAGLLPKPFNELDPRTRLSLLLFLVGTRAQNEELIELAIGGIRDRTVENRALMKAAADNGLIFHQFRLSFTPSPYDVTHQLEKLRIITWLVRSVGYRGLCVLVDELSSIVNLPTVSRKKCYQTLLQVAQSRYVQGLAYVFTVMPAFLTELRRDVGVQVEGASELTTTIRQNSIALSDATNEDFVEIAVTIERLSAIAGNRGDLADRVRGEASALLGSGRRAWTNRDWVRHWVTRLRA
jgi:hypothetical protein